MSGQMLQAAPCPQMVAACRTLTGSPVCVSSGCLVGWRPPGPLVLSPDTQASSTSVHQLTPTGGGILDRSDSKSYLGRVHTSLVSFFF